jgi:hypothetical protein
VFDKEPSGTNPGLNVNGIGIIGLPLSEHYAKELIKVSHQAPFGKGSQTIVDTTVRKTWELSPDQFELRNPAWQKTVQNIVAFVCKLFGIQAASSDVKAELYKMLLYETGAMFKPHKEYGTLGRAGAVS